MPRSFDRRVAVPGLVDLAKPAFAEVGTAKSGEHRQAFWYRRGFAIEGPIPETVRLKLHKAMFGTRVYLNGTLVGDQSSTPGIWRQRFHARRVKNVE